MRIICGNLLSVRIGLGRKGLTKIWQEVILEMCVLEVEVVSESGGRAKKVVAKT